MNPNVGLTVEVSSFMIHLTMVVFPALSRPLLTNYNCEPEPFDDMTYSISTLSSLSFSRDFRNMESILGSSCVAGWLFWAGDVREVLCIPVVRMQTR